MKLPPQKQHQPRPGFRPAPVMTIADGTDQPAILLKVEDAFQAQNRQGRSEYHTRFHFETQIHGHRVAHVEEVKVSFWGGGVIQKDGRAVTTTPALFRRYLEGLTTLSAEEDLQEAAQRLDEWLPAHLFVDVQRGRVTAIRPRRQGQLSPDKDAQMPLNGAPEPDEVSESEDVPF